MTKTKGRILCVDDEPNILRSLKWMLQKDFEVHIATSGQAGLMLVGGAAQSRPPHDRRLGALFAGQRRREHILILRKAH